jgi:hypothetical protein
MRFVQRVLMSSVWSLLIASRAAFSSAAGLLCGLVVGESLFVVTDGDLLLPQALMTIAAVIVRTVNVVRLMT